MTSKIRQRGVQCSRQQVANFLRAFDPDASSDRKSKRLVSPDYFIFSVAV